MSPQKSVGKWHSKIKVNDLQNFHLHKNHLLTVVGIITDVEKVVKDWRTALLQKPKQDMGTGVISDPTRWGHGWGSCRHQQTPGPRFNIKMSSYQYRKSHCGDKTVIRSSYLHNGISYTGKMSSLYWIRALDLLSDTDDWIWESQPTGPYIQDNISSQLGIASPKHWQLWNIANPALDQRSFNSQWQSLDRTRENPEFFQFFRHIASLGLDWQSRMAAYSLCLPAHASQFSRLGKWISAFYLLWYNICQITSILGQKAARKIS